MNLVGFLNKRPGKIFLWVGNNTNELSEIMKDSLVKKVTFFHHAVTLCLLSPFIWFVLTLFVFMPASIAHPPKTRMDAIANAVIISIVPVVGIISGIVSLFGIRRHGSKATLWKSVIGLTIIGLMFLAAVPPFLKALEAAKHKYVQPQP